MYMNEKKWNELYMYINFMLLLLLLLLLFHSFIHSFQTTVLYERHFPHAW